MTIEHFGVLGVHRGQEAAPHALRGELYRRQRILDFMCQTARDLTPGGLALRLQQRGDVVDDDNVTAGFILARQRQTRAHE